ncbi:MAG: RDD family protein, partial [Pirellulales bacterium]
MSDSFRFETPENVQVSYEPAGLGTRYVAWLLDSILVLFLCFVLFVAMVIVGSASEGVFRQIVGPLEDFFEGIDPEAGPQIAIFFIGVWTLVWGLGSFAYFGLSELFMRGQTIGKRAVAIRVVKADGFSLDPGSIFIRNIFRVLDQLPMLWVVPVVSAKSQRFGDMVAATLVIVD